MKLLSLLSALSLKALRSLKRKILSYIEMYPLTSFMSSVVLMLHLSFIIYMTVQKKPPSHPIPIKLAIHTTVLPKEVMVHTKASPSSKKQIVSKAVPVKAQIKKLPATKASNKKPVALPSAQNKKREELLKNLQESLSKLEQDKPTSQTQALHIPKEIKELKTLASSIEPDNENQIISPKYQSTLVTYLKDALALPSEGLVKVKLTLNMQGQCIDLKIIESDSEVNRLYLEKHLQDLLFPPFSHELENRDCYTFSLTFCGK